MNAKEALAAPSTLEAMLPYREMLERALEFAGGTHCLKTLCRQSMKVACTFGRQKKAAW